MQNQPGANAPKQASDQHDQQAAGLSEDTFKGGSETNGGAVSRWLRSPWRPAAGRLFDRSAPHPE